MPQAFLQARPHKLSSQGLKQFCVRLRTTALLLLSALRIVTLKSQLGLSGAHAMPTPKSTAGMTAIPNMVRHLRRKRWDGLVGSRYVHFDHLSPGRLCDLGYAQKRQIRKHNKAGFRLCSGQATSPQDLCSSPNQLQNKLERVDHRPATRIK